MIRWLPGWVWLVIGAILAVTAAYYVLADALDVLMRRWARRTGCPVCGAGPVRADRGQGGGQVRESGGEDR